MLRCEDCGEIFESPKTKRSLVIDDPYPVYENIAVCPECGSTEMEYVEECEECGCWVPPDELLEVSDDGELKSVCTDCYDEIYFVPPEGTEEE